MNAPQPPEPAEHTPAVRADDSDGRRAHSWGFGAFFLAEAVFVLVSVTLAAALENPGDDAGAIGFALMLTLILPTVLAAVVALIVPLVRGNGPRQDFGLQWRRSDVRTGLWIGVGGLVVTTLATMLWTRWMGPQASSAIGGLLDGVRLPPVVAVVVFLHVWLVAPFCEELLYRGLLWGAMEQLRFKQLTVFLLSTALFAIGHLEPSRTLLLLVIALPIGLARLLTGRLIASVVAHQVNNFLPALGLLLMSLGLLPA
ncbi:hypothetical protein FHX42_000583 [Saccharopolyspora lacisalsi]|uniref:CAAX prenyl protease 2/Lysostaphin resistance protein A-like domain-containing protein n=1 Tax=Halosaccharopolyspora lacisalsi TaxID=1000566 RepID=A0A839DP40_9PSEU|nr:type II CAAX endopeptidase family protein [Halosaccharopolyspora lacisalsi]MBA8823254.1 hypothetical protein [Halosaccharopolyspora lacisalsi]